MPSLRDLPTCMKFFEYRLSLALVPFHQVGLSEQEIRLHEVAAEVGQYLRCCEIESGVRKLPDAEPQSAAA